MSDAAQEGSRPIRIRRRRTKGWKMPQMTIYVGRGSIWGNPFRIGEHWRHGACRVETGNVAFNTQLLKAFGDRKLSQEDCVLAYCIYLDYAGVPNRDEIWPEPSDLKGRNLACWCSLFDSDGRPTPCHADVLLELANGSAVK